MVRFNRRRSAEAAVVGQTSCFVTGQGAAYVSQRQHNEADPEVIAALACISLATELGSTVAAARNGLSAFQGMMGTLVDAGTADRANGVYNTEGVFSHRGTDADMPKGTVAWVLGKSWLTPGAEGLLVETWRESQGYQPAEHGFRALAALWHLADQVGAGRVVWHAFNSLSDLDGIRMDDLHLRAGLPSLLLDGAQEMAAIDLAADAGWAEVNAASVSDESWPASIDGADGTVRLVREGLELDVGGRRQQVGGGDLGAMWRPGPAQITLFARGGRARRLTFRTALDCQEFCDAWPEQHRMPIKVGVPRKHDGSELGAQQPSSSDLVTPRHDAPAPGWYPATDGSGDEQWWTGSAWGPKRS